MFRKSWIFLIPLLILGATSLFAQPVLADRSSQVAYQTPTARPDGRVVYIVQPGDTCLRIQLLTGVTDEQLRKYNKLDQNCSIRDGQELLLTVITPAATPTTNPKMTATPLLPTPTPLQGSGKVCVSLFNDINGNATHEESEPVIAGGAVSITNSSANVSKSGSTKDGATMLCEDVPEGDYTISLAIPTGYNATTRLNRPVKVQAGDQSILEFGAQISTIQPPVIQETETNTNMLIAVAGGVLVVLGIGLGVYAAIFTRR